MPMPPFKKSLPCESMLSGKSALEVGNLHAIASGFVACDAFAREPQFGRCSAEADFA